MANVPGLTGFSEDRPSVGGRNTGRVISQGASFRPQSLRPQAQPVDTFVRPAAEQGGWLDLARALSSVSPEITDLLQSQQKKEQKNAEDRAAQRIGGMTFEEADRAMKSGEITEMSNPWYKAAWMKQYGERLAYQRMNELSTEYETSPDKVSLNMDELVSGRMKEDLDRWGSSPTFTASYNAVMGQFRNKAQSAQTQYKSQQMVEDSKQGIYDTFLGRVREMQQAGASPADIANTLRMSYEGNKKLLNIGFKDQDAELMRVAQTLSDEGDYELVKELLTTDRTAADGTKLGKLMDSRDSAAKAANILEAAERNMWEKNQRSGEATHMTFWDAARAGKLDRQALEDYSTQNPGAISLANKQQLIAMSDNVVARAQEAQQKQAAKLNMEAAARASERDLLMTDMFQLENGRLPFINTAEVLTDSGNRKEVSIETRKQNVARQWLKDIDSTAKNAGMSDDQKMDATIQRFATGGINNPVWENVLSAGMTGANAWSISNGGNIPPALTNGVKLYEQLYAKAPALLRQHVKSAATLDFYEAYRTGRELGYDENQAIASAVQVTKDPASTENPMVRTTYDAIDKAVNNTVDGGWFGWDKPAINRAEIGGEIAKTAKFYARLGQDSDKAIALATERFKDTHAEVNGYWLPVNRSQVPANFTDLAKTVLQDYADSHPDEGLTADDLTIKPAGNGIGGWIISTKNDLMPVEDRDARSVSLQTMAEADERRKQRVKQGLIDKSNNPKGTGDRGYLAPSLPF